MRKTYSPEYKEYVVKLVLEEGRKMSELSRELEIPYGTMNKWVMECRNKGKQDKEAYQTPSELAKKEERYLKEIRELQEEVEILKKAM
ncbi:transposase, partial [Peribacillus kribbensis]